MNDIADALTASQLLVNVTLNRWSARKTDKKASEEVTTNNHARSDSAKVVKDLMAGARDELKAVASAQDAIRTYVRAVTLPWSSSQNGRNLGARLIPAANSFEFLAHYKSLSAVYDKALADFMAVYNVRRNEAMANLGTLAVSSDYPDAQEISYSFNVSLDLSPVPAQDDYSRLALPVDVIDALGQRMAKQHQAKVDNAMNDLGGRIVKELRRMATVFKKHSTGERTPLHGSLITTMQSLTSLLRNSNIGSKPELDELADKLDALTQYDIKLLRANVTTTAQVAEEATAVLDSFDEYFF